MTSSAVYLKDLVKCDKWLYDLAEGVDKRKRAANESQQDKLDADNGWLSPREQQRLEQEIREYFSFKNPNYSEFELEQKVNDTMDEVYSKVPGWNGFKQRVRYAVGTLFPSVVDKFEGIASK